MTVSHGDAVTSNPRYDYEPVLEGRDVSVHYGGVKAVEGMTFGLRPGVISGILGPNGSGKTTLLGGITRMVNLTRGSISFLGQDYTNVPARDVIRLGMGRTYQTVRLLPDRTVRENIFLATDVILKKDPERAAAQVERAIELTDVRSVEIFRPGELSYGVQRRVEIARALASDPKLLLLDEPTAGMNKSERASVATLLSELRSEGLTQLLVEHDVQMMVDTCDYLYAMNFGSMIAEGSPEDVVRNPDVQEAYLGKHGRRDA